jgi:hypothetical protein
MEPWHDFYVTAGGAAAAPAGILFVGVSLHLDAVMSRPDVAEAEKAVEGREAPPRDEVVPQPAGR